MYVIYYFLYCTFSNIFFFFSSRRRHTRLVSDWSSDVCSSDLLDSAESYEVLDRYMPLAQYLQAKSGAVVMLIPVRVPGAAIQRMIEDGKSYRLFFGPPVFAAEAIKKADFVTIAMEQEKIRGVFLVKAR